MNRPFGFAAAAAAIVLLAGCASAPTQFYTLLPQTPEPAASATANYQIAVLPVSIPAQVDQPELVVRQSNDRVALLEGQQWLGPLGDQIRDAVSERLQRDLGAVDVEGLPQTAKGKLFQVKLNIRRFESVVGQYARIDAAWSVDERDPAGPAINCSSSIRQPVGKGYSALVQGHQQALAILSGQIANVIRSLAAESSANCPQ